MTEFEKEEKRFEHYIILGIIACVFFLIDLGIMLAEVIL